MDHIRAPEGKIYSPEERGKSTRGTQKRAKTKKVGIDMEKIQIFLKIWKASFLTLIFYIYGSEIFGKFFGVLNGAKSNAKRN